MRSLPILLVGLLMPAAVLAQDTPTDATLTVHATAIERAPSGEAPMISLNGAVAEMVEADGAITFEGLAPGTYDIAATQTGFHGHTARVQLDAGEDDTVTLTLWPDAEVILTGRVASPLEGDQVAILLEGATAANAGQTYGAVAEDGTFQIDGIPAGYYRLEARSLGNPAYEVIAGEVDLLGDADLSLSLHDPAQQPPTSVEGHDTPYVGSCSAAPRQRAPRWLGVLGLLALIRRRR